MRRARSSHLRSLLLLAALAAPLACSDATDPFEPSVDTVAGSYVATTFTVTEGGTTTDLLRQGASLQLMLAPDRTATGRLFIPDGDEGGDLDASMAGTWTVNGDIVRFQQTADTFVRDTPFTVDALAELRADVTFGDARLRVTLRRTP